MTTSTECGENWTLSTSFSDKLPTMQTFLHQSCCLFEWVFSIRHIDHTEQTTSAICPLHFSTFDRRKWPAILLMRSILIRSFHFDRHILLRASSAGSERETKKRPFRRQFFSLPSFLSLLRRFQSRLSSFDDYSGRNQRIRVCSLDFVFDRDNRDVNRKESIAKATFLYILSIKALMLFDRWFRITHQSTTTMTKKDTDF